jgi:hypothetical protein
MDVIVLKWSEIAMYGDKTNQGFVPYADYKKLLDQFEELKRQKRAAEQSDEADA